jgi:hypothetical protein
MPDEALVMQAYGNDIVAVIAMRRVVNVNGDVSDYPTDLLFRCPGIEHPGLCTTTTCETLCEKYTRCTRITDMLDFIKFIDGDGGGFCRVCGEFINSGDNCYRVEGLGDCYGEECLKKALKLRDGVKVTNIEME